MVLVLKYGQMVQNMKVNGEIIKLMERGNFGMLMEMFMKEIGRMTRLTALAFIFTLMEPNMKEIGRMICKMDGELKVGQMVAGMKEATEKE